MSFFETFKDIGGGDWISADEKAVLIEEGIPVAITDVIYEETSQFGNPRYICKVLLHDPESGEDEPRLLGFTAETVQSRDRMLKAMQEYLDENEGEQIAVKLDKVGRAIILVSPDSDPTPTPAAASSRGTGTRSRRR